MRLDRRRLLALAGSAALAPAATAQTTLETDPLATAQRDLLFGDGGRALSALDRLAIAKQPDTAAALILARRYRSEFGPQISTVLRGITGAQEAASWFDWMLWQESNPQITPHPAYADIKRDLFLGIDENFDVFLRPEYLARDRMRIRLEEITWGGVRKDGIPSLDNPRMLPARRAGYLREDDLVFGVSINGDIRAYPLRIMGWHEMFNEVIGGVPVALAYCTLCGSGILFETQLQPDTQPFVFGSSGFLYRSNKLMFDRQTHSLWNQFTGRPVVGPLVDSGFELRQRPVVIASWRDWLRDNPTTQVLSLRTGHRRDYGSGVVYRDYFSSDDLMFPALVDQSQHRQKDYVFGVRVMGAAKAWPLSSFEGRAVINDRIADLPLVLLGDPGTRAVRAYERGGLQFEAVEGGLRAADGTLWQVTEEALQGPGGATLPRVAGHIAYWFAWNGYLGAESEVFEG